MKKTKIILFVLTMILLTNCAKQSPSEIANANTHTLTTSIEPSPTATRTPQPTSTPTLTPSVTWTPLPTLSVQDANTKITELLETNGGCELPCWWGITPNSTLWSEALHFLSPFISNMKQGRTEEVLLNGEVRAVTNINVYYPTQDNINVEIWLTTLDNTVLDITVFPLSTQYKYQLYQILSLLGMPKQIYVSAQASAPYPILPPTVLVLDYSDNGVWASYGYIPSEVGENLVICPEPGGEKLSVYDNVGGRLELFDPHMENDQAISIQEYAYMVGGSTAKKLEDATNMTIETFYNTFINPKPEDCLDTPASLWP